MMLPKPVTRFLASILQQQGYLAEPISSAGYHSDGMFLFGRELGFMTNQRFQAAYKRGMASGHHIGRPKGSDDNIGIEYRAYIECWAAEHGLLLEGDFVCCGVNTGIIPLTICDYLDFNQSGKRFWLFDTYNGIPEAQMSASERPDRLKENSNSYSDCFAMAVKNFAPFQNAKLVKGAVPESLLTVEVNTVAYLSIDMNIAYPERAAIEYFWPKLASGAIVVLDDYGFKGYGEQKATMDEFATTVGTKVLTLPTGQGILIKR